MFQCLQENIAQAAFGSACRAEVESRTSLMQDDYRLDYSLSSSCTHDVDRLCSEEKVCDWPPASCLLQTKHVGCKAIFTMSAGKPTEMCQPSKEGWIM